MGKIFLKFSKAKGKMKISHCPKVPSNPLFILSASNINQSLSFPVFDKTDQCLDIIKVVIIAVYSLTVIDNTCFLISFKAVQKLCLPISFDE